MPFDNANYQPDDEVLRCLIETREILAQGRCRCFFTDARGQHCFEGALEAATPVYAIRQQAKVLLRAELPTGTYDKYRGACLMIFNDASSTTDEDVQAVCDRAIAARRAALVSA